MPYPQPCRLAWPLRREYTMLTVRRRGTTALPAAYQPRLPKDSCGPGNEFIELSALAPVHVGSLRDSAAACAPAKLSNWPSRALPTCLPLGQACSTDTRDWCTLCDYGRDTTVPGLPPTSLLGYPLVLEYCAVGNAVTCSNVLMTSIKSHLQELFRVFQVPFRNP